MYDEGARSWMADIEAMHRELEEARKAEAEEQKRNKRLVSEKGKAASQAKLSALNARIVELDKRIACETEKFFSTVLGITEHGVATLEEKNGTQGVAVVVRTMRVRCLSDGSVTLMVGGDPLDEVEALFVRDKYLFAAENNGQKLVPLA